MDLLGMDPAKLKHSTVCTTVPLERLQEIKRDAERYRKLKAHIRWLRQHGVGILDDANTDAAVDALPEVK